MFGVKSRGNDGLCDSENIFFGRNQTDTEKIKFEAKRFCKIHECICQNNRTLGKNGGGEIKGAGAALENLFTKYLEKTISIRDTFVRKPTKENFYHGILLGILGFKKEM